MSGHPLLLIGAGGHALVLLDALSLSRATVLGLIDTDPALAGRRILGFAVLGGDEALRGHQPGAVRLVNAIGSVGSMSRRRSIYESLSGMGYPFVGVLHPSAVISRHAVVATSAQVMAGAVVQPGASLGENSIINTGATVDHDCRIGAHVHIGPGVTLSGNVQVGDETHVGAGATVIQGVRIGARCTVAAGAVVLNDIADGTMVAGVPAREARK